jgi:hypothetical protein
MYKIFLSLMAFAAAAPAAIRITVPASRGSRSDGLRRSGLHCVWRRDASSGALLRHWYTDD